MKKYKDKNKLRIGEGKEMPEDFWNYHVNPIVGYWVPPPASPKRETPKKIEKYLTRNNYLNQ